MSFDLSRRSLLGGALTGAATAAASGTIMSPAMARTCLNLEPGKKESMYGPDPSDAWLIFNENPFGPSPAALKALAEASTQGAYYQNQSTAYLAEMIAERHGVAPEQVMISNGSYEGLTAVALAFRNEGTTLGCDLFWDSTARYAERNGFSTIVRAPMKDGMQVDLEKIKAMVDDSVGLVHIVNPNNPTGVMLPPEELRAFIKEVAPQKTVLVDEAYIELSDDPEGNSMMDLLRDGENIIVARTFSKIYGMAGLRVGYTIAQPDMIEKIRPYIVSSPNVAGIAAAINSYNDEAFLKYSKERLVAAREMIMEGAKANGLTALPSQTSFVFVDTGMDADVFRDRMGEKGVRIRGTYGDFTPYSRVSCGYEKDVKRYVDAIPYALDGA